jgi:FixJ family two-component response regulator
MVLQLLGIFKIFSVMQNHSNTSQLTAEQQSLLTNYSELTRKERRIIYQLVAQMLELSYAKRNFREVVTQFNIVDRARA